MQSRLECQGAHSNGRSTLCVKYHLKFKINLILIVQGYEKSLYQWAFYLLKICPSFFGSFENLSERYEEKLSSIFYHCSGQSCTYTWMYNLKLKYSMYSTYDLRNLFIWSKPIDHSWVIRPLYQLRNIFFLI